MGFAVARLFGRRGEVGCKVLVSFWGVYGIARREVFEINMRHSWFGWFLSYDHEISNVSKVGSRVRFFWFAVVLGFVISVRGNVFVVMDIR